MYGVWYPENINIILEKRQHVVFIEWHPTEAGSEDSLANSERRGIHLVTFYEDDILRFLPREFKYSLVIMMELYARLLGHYLL